MRTRNIFALAALVAMLFQLAFAGTTGKVTGVIKDAGSGEPLVGVNVILKGTILGASTDADGYYAILNIPPASTRWKRTTSATRPRSCPMCW